MRKSFLCALVLAGAFLFAPAASAQFTTVTATVNDPNGIPYAGAVMNAILVPSTGGGYTLSGNPYFGRIGPVTLDSAGKFTVNFGDVTLISPGSPQWQITIDSAAATIQGPLGTGPQSFTYTSTGTTISGGSPVSLTTALNALAHALTNISLGSGSVTSVAATSPIVVTPSPITTTGTISCPTCNTSGATIAGSIASTQVAYGSSANTITGDAGLTWITASKRVQVGDSFAGLSASTLFPITGQPYNVQSITHTAATSPSFVSVVGVVESNGAVDSSSNHIGGGYFVANATAELTSATGTAPLTGVQATGISSHSTGNEGQTLGGLFTGENTGAGTVTDLAGLAAQSVVSGAGLVTSASAIDIYTPTVTGGTPPTNEYGLNINAISGGVANNAINISNQGAANWSLHAGTGKLEAVGPMIFDGTSSGSAAINVPAAAGTPCTILLPTTSPSANQFLQSAAPSSGNCQTTWATPGAGTIAIPATVSGATSGGIPCFDSTTDMNTSGAITVNHAITGGGAGACAKDSGIIVYTGQRAAVATNTAVGVGALAANGSGTDIDEAAFGVNALLSETGSAGGGNSTAIGVAACRLQNGSTGLNTCIGENSLGSNVTGNQDTAVGGGACSASTGSNNTCLGQGTATSSAGDHDEIVLGQGATGAGNLTATIGASGITDVHHGGSADAAIVHAKAYATASNCSSSASPAVCGSASAGSVAVPTGTNATLVVNTTSVTANSQIFVQSDDTLGTKLGVTCNSTLASLIVEPVVTARTGGTSFTITISGTTTTNPVCLSYFIVN